MPAVEELKDAKISASIRYSADPCFNEAIAAALQSGLKWMEEKLVLQPSEKLIKLIRLSQEAAAKEESEEKAEGAAE